MLNCCSNAQNTVNSSQRYMGESSTTIEPGSAVRNNVSHPTEVSAQALNATSPYCAESHENRNNSQPNSEVFGNHSNCSCVPDATLPSILGRLKENGVPFEWFICSVILTMIFSIITVILTFLLIHNNKNNAKCEKHEQDNHTELREIFPTNYEEPYERYEPAEIELYSDDPNSPSALNEIDVYFFDVLSY